jgi:membrane-bound lytic murein transglycosylase B
MKFSKSFFIIISFLVLAFVAVSYQPIRNVLAQDANPQLSPEERAQLEAQLAQIEQQIAAQQQILNQKKQEGASISRDIAILNAQIKQAQLKIQAHNLAISKLGKDITVKVQIINVLDTHISQEQESLGQIIRQTHQLDSYSLAEALLSGRPLSDFLLDMDTYATLNEALKAKVDQIQADKTQNEQQKTALDQQRNQEIDTKINIQNEQAKIKKAEAQKQVLLNANKQEQQGYQSVIATQQAKAAAIRNKLFPLRDVPAIKFGDAVTYANVASRATGVDPAFLLAIITQESNLGSNVGACYLKDSSGAGTKISTGEIVPNLMKPDRDVAPFLEITAAVGRDPYHTKVSCPFSVGYGGAMGPAQFIPSTWKLNQSRIAAALGKSVPDPWNPQDAFMASALYLEDLGAVSGSYTAERNAACKYYSGRSCGGSNAFYGDQVMAKVQDIQANIDVLNG